MFGSQQCLGGLDLDLSGDTVDRERDTATAVTGQRDRYAAERIFGKKVDLGDAGAAFGVGSFDTGKVDVIGQSRSVGVRIPYDDRLFGQFGNGTATETNPTPLPVSGGLTFTSEIAAGISHTCGVTTSGTVYCWGGNYYGQLGDRTTTDRLTPVLVLGQ